MGLAVCPDGWGQPSLPVWEVDNVFVETPERETWIE
jgi:hypothetical protein